MKNFLLAIVLIIPGLSAFGQCAEDVQNILNQLRTQINKAEAYQITFSYEQSFVGESPSQYKGTLLVSNQQFKLSLPDQEFISDGQTLWVVIPESKEVQVMDLDEETGIGQISPIEILNTYCSEDYLSQAIGTTRVNGRAVEQFEFTPVDKSEDIFKIRISYDPQKRELYEARTFSKDGSRMTITANAYNFTPSVSNNDFSFNTGSHPSFEVIDLRD